MTSTHVPVCWREALQPAADKCVTSADSRPLPRALGEGQTGGRQQAVSIRPAHNPDCAGGTMSKSAAAAASAPTTFSTSPSALEEEMPVVVTEDVENDDPYVP